MEPKPEEEYVVNNVLHEIKVKDVMVTPAITIGVEEDFHKVEELFVNHKIRHLPVVDGSRVLVGMITQKDVYKVISPRRLLDESIERRKDIIIDQDSYYNKDVLDSYILHHLMQKDPKTLPSTAILGDAIHQMVHYHIGAIPIVDKKKKVVGILTRYDVLKAADRIFMMLENEKNKGK